MEITADLLRDIFRYERGTGKLYWSKNVKSYIKRATPDTEVGHLRKDGYRAVKLFGKQHMVHRLVFWLTHGYDAEGFVDHIDHNRSNNRVENLREVSPSENAMNKSNTGASSTGYQGVYYDRRKHKYVAQVRYHGRKVLYNYYSTLDAAVEAREKFLKEKGFHSNHGN